MTATEQPGPPATAEAEAEDQPAEDVTSTQTESAADTSPAEGD